MYRKQTKPSAEKKKTNPKIFTEKFMGEMEFDMRTLVSLVSN